VRRVDEKEGEQRHQRDAAEYWTRALHELTIHPPAAVYAAAPDSFSAAWAAPQPRERDAVRRRRLRPKNAKSCEPEAHRT
jgi:hypothetical protein